MGLFGTDEVVEEKQEENVVSMEEAKKSRKPYHVWTVAGKEHKMLLTTSEILKLEDKYRTNLMNLVMTDSIPTLSVMLTLAKGSMVHWENGISDKVIKDLYDAWMKENNGNQQQFYLEVIMPVMTVSGFFTESQAQEITERLQELQNAR